MHAFLLNLLIPYGTQLNLQNFLKAFQPKYVTLSFGVMQMEEGEGEEEAAEAGGGGGVWIEGGAGTDTSPGERKAA